MNEDRVKQLNDIFYRNWTEERWLEWSPYGMSRQDTRYLLGIIDDLTPF